MMRAFSGCQLRLISGMWSLVDQSCDNHLEKQVLFSGEEMSKQASEMGPNSISDCDKS